MDDKETAISMIIDLPDPYVSAVIAYMTGLLDAVKKSVDEKGRAVFSGPGISLIAGSVGHLPVE